MSSLEQDGIDDGQPRKLPVVLSADEVVQFLEAVSSLKSRAALTTAYAAGLRASEVAGLRIEAAAKRAQIGHLITPAISLLLSEGVGSNTHILSARRRSTPPCPVRRGSGFVQSSFADQSLKSAKVVLARQTHIIAQHETHDDIVGAMGARSAGRLNFSESNLLFALHRTHNCIRKVTPTMELFASHKSYEIGIDRPRFELSTSELNNE